MIIIDGNHLTINDIVSVARCGSKVELADEARLRVEMAHTWVEEIVTSKKPVYGINTGFGIFAEQGIPPEDGAILSRNLILSHAVCTGKPLSKDVVRAAMLVRANTLAKGHSGVRSEIIDTILAMLNLNLIPVVPSQGSLGSSGDLGPLSQLALVFTTDGIDLEEESGFAEFRGNILTGKKAMAEAGLSRVQLGPKEGLALNNGATFSAAIAALVIYDTTRLLDLADINLSLCLESLLGSLSPFEININRARGHPGQMTVAENVRWLTRDSTLIGSAFRIQDAYSLRCAPQVHGSVRDTLTFAQTVIDREINAATDNPLLFGPLTAVSGGNFHGEPIGMVMDFLKIAVSELAAISERRTFRLADAKLNYGLPPMLVDSHEAAGLNSGIMMLQYTAASLVLENQTLATSDSVHNLPTSGEQEDHNANSMTAARHCEQVVTNTAHVLSIELFTVVRALYERLRQMPNLKPGIGTAMVYRIVQEAVPFHAMDTWWAPEIDKVKALIDKAEIFQAVEK